MAVLSSWLVFGGRGGAAPGSGGAAPGSDLMSTRMGATSGGNE